MRPGSSEPGDEAEDPYAGAMTVRPQEGVLQLFSKVPVDFSFKPVLPPVEKGFAAQPGVDHDAHQFALNVLVSSWRQNSDTRRRERCGTRRTSRTVAAQLCVRRVQCQRAARHSLRDQEQWGCPWSTPSTRWRTSQAPIPWQARAVAIAEDGDEFCSRTDGPVRVSYIV